MNLKDSHPLENFWPQRPLGNFIVASHQFQNVFRRNCMNLCSCLKLNKKYRKLWVHPLISTRLTDRKFYKLFDSLKIHPIKIFIFVSYHAGRNLIAAVNSSIPCDMLIRLRRNDNSSKNNFIISSIPVWGDRTKYKQPIFRQQMSPQENLNVLGFLVVADRPILICRVFFIFVNKKVFNSKFQPPATFTQTFHLQTCA